MKAIAYFDRTLDRQTFGFRLRRGIRISDDYRASCAAVLEQSPSFGLQVLQALIEDLTVPFGNRNRLGSGCDAVPQRLQVVDLLVDRQIVETGRRQRDWLGHDVLRDDAVQYSARARIEAWLARFRLHLGCSDLPRHASVCRVNHPKRSFSSRILSGFDDSYSAGW